MKIIHIHPIYEAVHCGTESTLITINPNDVTCPVCLEKIKKQEELNLSNNKGLTITFPRLKFVSNNSLLNQVHKMEAELMEVKRAFLEPGYDHLAEEMYDLAQASVTGLLILAEHRGVDVEAVIRKCKCKLKDKGYMETMERRYDG